MPKFFWPVILLVVLAVGFYASQPQPVSPRPSLGAGGCIASGCSGQVCSDAGEGPVVTTCEFLSHYACYQQMGICERQSNGRCGWTQTPELLNCIQRTKAQNDFNLVF